jgi:hypothetical protein
MLPDFPKAKAKGNQVFVKAIEARLARSPILGQIRHTRQHEGKSSLLRREDMSEATIEYRRGGQTVVTSREEMRVWDPELVVKKVEEIANGLEEQQTRALFEELERATQATGNVVNVQAKGLQKEHFLEIQRKIIQGFDPETGEPTGGMMVVHPDTLPAIQKAMEEWGKDEEFQKELKRIQGEKREEWRAREASRKLVD